MNGHQLVIGRNLMKETEYGTLHTLFLYPAATYVGQGNPCTDF